MSVHSLDWLFDSETISFLRENETADPEQLLLSKVLRNKGWDVSILVRQLKGIKTAKHKFPFLYRNTEVLYPPAVSLEQASSEITARYKASLYKADKIADLSGGMGVDSYFFSLQSKQVVYIEPYEELFQITAHNFKALGVENIKCICTTAADFVATDKNTYDLIYIDPSRRKEGKRLADYAEWEPDIVGLKPLLWKATDRMLIKLSPMTDISMVCKALGEVKDVYVVSDRNECKEVLVFLEKDFRGEPRIHASLLYNDTVREYSFLQSEEQLAISPASDPLNYLYEPDVALLKAGAFKKVAVDHAVKKIHPHTHLYTSDECNENFPGKTFKIEDVREYSKKAVTDLIAKEKDFHVLTRNAAVTPEQIKKQYKLIERGNKYLIVFKCATGANLICKALRLK